MNKELEALEKELNLLLQQKDNLLHKQARAKTDNEIKYWQFRIDKFNEKISAFTNIKQRLEAIDNAKPSEALKKLDDIYRNGVFISGYDALGKQQATNISPETNKSISEQCDIIKQALLKSQEQEKENAYIEKIKTMLKQKDCVLRYIESEDCFAVKTILSDSWYKLTPEFVENNVREEIKPLPLIEKNKQLKEENSEYKKVLEIIKEKKVDIYILSDLGKLDDYNKWVLQRYGTYYQLTEKEFELLKRYFEKNIQK
jgi:adenosine deaminase